MVNKRLILNQRDVHYVHLPHIQDYIQYIQKSLYFISNEINGPASRCFDHFSDYFLTAHLSATCCVCVSSSVCVFLSLCACVLTAVAAVLVVLEASRVCEIGVGAEAGHTHRFAGHGGLALSDGR